jgi:outer membrane protein TolC
LGLGEAAVRDGAGSLVRQAQIQELAAMDMVAREVAATQAQVQLRSQQIETAKEVVRVGLDSFEHNYARISRGEGLPIEALQSAQALLQARREYLRAVSDYNAAQFSLQRALGWPVGQPELAASSFDH